MKQRSLPLQRADLMEKDLKTLSREELDNQNKFIEGGAEKRMYEGSGLSMKVADTQLNTVFGRQQSQRHPSPPLLLPQKKMSEPLKTRSHETLNTGKKNGQQKKT